MRRPAVLVALVALSLCYCATRPNRTEPKWSVAPAARSQLPLRMADAVVENDGKDCTEREGARAENMKNVVERELYDAGFTIAKDGESVDDEPLDVVVRVKLKDCSEGLFGDLGVTLKNGATTVFAVDQTEVFFSNLRAGANLLVDGVVASDAVATFASSGVVATSSVSEPMVPTSTTTSSTVSATN